MITLKFKNPVTGECFGVEIDELTVFDVVDELTLYGAEVITFLEFEKYEKENEMEFVRMDGMWVIQKKYAVAGSDLNN